MRHIPVLLNEVIEALQLKSGMNIIDCTLGDAGHSEKVLELISPDGKLLGIDADPEAILRAKQYLYKYSDRVVFARNNFENIKKIVEENKFKNVQGVLMDFGWSSPQFEERGRGFSFQNADEDLNMRYSGSEGDTAENILNNEDEKELNLIFKKYGEEKFSKEIAERIVETRKSTKSGSALGGEIKKVGDLVEIILQVYREKLKTDKDIPWIGGIHPATKVFQALRIAVNNEYGVIEKVLPQAVEILKTGGRLAVITFHSGEDRIVKHYFKSQNNKTLKIINKKPIIATGEEIKNNPRARSAKLRVIERI